MTALPDAWQALSDKAERDEAAKKARRIGSTDIAAICAFYNPALALELPKSKTAADVWLRLMYGFDAPRNSRMDRGNRVEPIAIDYYREHVGPAWRPLPTGEWWTLTDARNPEFTASPDAWDAPDPRIVIEAKSWSEAWGRAHWGTPGTDEMATRFLYQCQWLMARSGPTVEQAIVLVLFGNDVPVLDEDGQKTGEEFVITEPAIYRTERDDAFIAQLDAYGERFLNDFVRTGIPPPVKPHANRTEAKRKLNERSGSAAAEWYERCEAHAAALGLDDHGRPAEAEGAGDEARGGDGLG